MKNHMRVVWQCFALLAALSIAAPMALAAPIFKATMDNGNKVSLRLLDTQCSDAAVLKHMMVRVRPELLDKFKDARLHWDGKDWASC